MSINDLDRKLLWSRAGNWCAWPSCQQLLTLDASTELTGVLVESGVVIGEEAHIRGQKPTSARYDARYDKVDKYENLILLCPTHHTLIDKANDVAHTVGHLIQLKSEHERRVADKRPSTLNQQEIELSAAALAYWSTILDLDNWETRTQGLTMSQPSIGLDILEKVGKVARWLLAFELPGDDELLRSALASNFVAMRALYEYCGSTFEPDSRRDDSRLYLPKEHKLLTHYNDALYKEKLRKFFIGVWYSGWLLDNASRSINFVIWAARQRHDALYRAQDGYVLMRVESGVLGYATQRREFELSQREGQHALPVPQEALNIITSWYTNDDHPSSVNPSLTELP